MLGMWPQLKHVRDIVNARNQKLAFVEDEGLHEAFTLAPLLVSLDSALS